MLAYDAGTEMTVEAVLDEIERYHDYCVDGVTLSGGEPLRQTAFCSALVDALHAKGIHVALDTAGSVYAPEVLKKVDLVILDIKHTDPQAFTALTGGKLDNMLKTLDYLKQHGVPFWIRQVIVEGITDGEEQLLRLKEMAQGAEKLELLPYHTMGANKWRKLGLTPPLEGLPPLSQEALARAQKIVGIV